MSKQTKISYDLSALENIVRQLGGQHVARIGILGSDAGAKHEGTDLTNAEIGVIQEFGSQSRNIPPRSFLRMPIEVRGATIMQQLGKRRTRDKIESGDIVGVYRDLGLAGEAVVQGAFASAGFGRWPANAPSTVVAKGSSAPLIDTGQLRRAITSDVVRKGDL